MELPTGARCGTKMRAPPAQCAQKACAPSTLTFTFHPPECQTLSAALNRQPMRRRLRALPKLLKRPFWPSPMA